MALSGCGGSGHSAATATSTSTSTTHAVPAGPSPVPERIVSRAKASILPVRCASDNANLAGTAFVTAGGIITALHVVAACAAAVSVGTATGNLVGNDRAHDLALLRTDGFESGSAPPALELESRRPAVGESLALFGFPGGRGKLSVLSGTIIAVDKPATLTSRDGVREKLNDVISVDVEGLAPGDSGGPAIDARGKVVGVVEAGGTGFAYLTPASHIQRGPQGA